MEKQGFKSLEIDCEKGFMSVNGKEIDINNITSVDIHVRAGIIELEIGAFIMGDFGNGRTERN